MGRISQAKITQGIFQSYCFYYRRKYGYVGYLYQGRYKSELIQDDSYLSECGRYIERNPVRAGIVKVPYAINEVLTNQAIKNVSFSTVSK